MTPQTVIDDVRVLIGDTELGSYRYSDDDLVKFVNESLKRIAHLRPDLFSTFATMSCTVSTVLQSAPSDSVRLVEVFQVTSGNAIYESDRKTMDVNSPGWRTATEAAATTWMRHARSANKFFIYPPCPSGGQSLEIEYAKVPTDYTIAQTIAELHDSYKSVVIDCVVFLAESIDDEHVTSGRAKLFYDSFTQTLGVSAQARTATDQEQAGIPREPNPDERLKNAPT